MMLTSCFISQGKLFWRSYSVSDLLSPSLVSNRKFTSRTEQVGIVTWMFVIFAFLDSFWGLMATRGTPEWNLWVIYFAELTAGVALAAWLSIRAQPQRFIGEGKAVTTGIIAWPLILLLQVGVFLTSQFIPFSTSGGIQLNLLAPVAETLFWNVAVYRGLRKMAPGLNWMFANVPSSFAFATFHFFAYGVDPVSWIILFGGMMILNGIYELTQNPAAPMTAHFMLNITPYWALIPGFLAQYIWLAFIPVVIIVVWILLGGVLRK